jgi:hypothetical protein
MATSVKKVMLLTISICLPRPSWRVLRNTTHAVKAKVILLNERQYLFPTKCQTTQISIMMVFSLLVPPEECRVNKSEFASCYFQIQSISADLEGSL